MTFPLKFNRKCIILHNNKENKSEPFLQIFLSFSAGSGNIMQTCFKIHFKPSEHLSWQPAARISMQITLRTQNIAQDVVAFDLMSKVPYFSIYFFKFFFEAKKLTSNPLACSLSVVSFIRSMTISMTALGILIGNRLVTTRLKNSRKRQDFSMKNTQLPCSGVN